MKIELPFPHKDLSPNSRIHYQERAKLRKQQRSDCYYLALNHKPEPAETYHIHITYHLPNNKNRDLDNLLASCKGMLDGLADAWKVNDKQFRPITIDFGEVVKDGKVCIEIYSPSKEGAFT